MMTAVSAFACGSLTDGSDDAEWNDSTEAGVGCDVADPSVLGRYFQERSSWIVEVVFV
jgi:hypothetical protein